MRIETLVSVEEYLSTSYDPDVEYEDGILVERNVGDWSHSRTQSNILTVLDQKHPQLYAVPGLCSQTARTRFRLPDVSVLLTPPETGYLIEAAYVAIEILSPDDRMSKVLEKLAEYEATGVPNIWLIDPRLRRMFVYRDHTLEEVESRLTAQNPRVELTYSEAFRRL